MKKKTVLRLEHLEDRITPTTYTWDGSNGYYSDSSHWSDGVGGHGVPSTTSDTAIINSGQCSMNNGSVSILSLQLGGGLLDLVNNELDAFQFYMSSGTLESTVGTSGVVNITADSAHSNLTSSWTGGTIGPTDSLGTGNFNYKGVSGSYFNIKNSVVFDTFNIQIGDGTTTYSSTVYDYGATISFGLYSTFTVTAFSTMYLKDQGIPGVQAAPCSFLTLGGSNDMGPSNTSNRFIDSGYVLIAMTMAGSFNNNVYVTMNSSVPFLTKDSGQLEIASTNLLAVQSNALWDALDINDTSNVIVGQAYGQAGIQCTGKAAEQVGGTISFYGQNETWNTTGNVFDISGSLNMNRDSKFGTPAQVTDSDGSLIIEKTASVAYWFDTNGPSYANFNLTKTSNSITVVNGPTLIPTPYNGDTVGVGYQNDPFDSYSIVGDFVLNTTYLTGTWTTYEYQSAPGAKTKTIVKCID